MVYTRSMMKKKEKSMEAKANNLNYSNLPFDLTLLIMQRLSLKTNIRASAVCKTWLQACVSVRVEDAAPWLMHFFFYKEDYVLYDPSLGKTHICKFPELGSQIHYSGDGWLLMDNRNVNETFFFNPFTRERINVPWSDMWRAHSIAFSCAPTSNNCVIFSVWDVGKTHVVIKTYRLATKEWTTLTFMVRSTFINRSFQHVVFSNGVFFCLTDIGCLGMFDISTNSWDILLQPPPKCPKTSQCFMAEYQGDIYLLCTHDLEKQTFVKLNLANRRWRDEIRLTGLTFYLGFQCVVATTRELVCTRVGLYNPLNVWIKPPKNVLDLFTY